MPVGDVYWHQVNGGRTHALELRNNGYYSKCDQLEAIGDAGLTNPDDSNVCSQCRMLVDYPAYLSMSEEDLQQIDRAAIVQDNVLIMQLVSKIRSLRSENIQLRTYFELLIPFATDLYRLPISIRTGFPFIEKLADLIDQAAGK